MAQRPALPVALAVLLTLPALPAFATHDITVPPGQQFTITVPGGATISVQDGEEPPPPTEQVLPILINAGGGEFVDTESRTWQGEAGLVSGGGAVNRGPIPISNTENDYLYQTERYGKASFAIPILPGRYDVRLHFAETYMKGPGRTTGAVVEGRALNPFDVFLAAGDVNRAVTRTVPDVAVTDGTLNVVLLGAAPTINAIEVAQANSLPADLPVPDPTPDPEPDPDDTTSIPQSEQCNSANAPALARAHGMTELAFCEDFSKPERINLTSGTLGHGQTFIQNDIFNAKRNPPDRFTFDDGVLTIRPTTSNYQGHLISSSRDGKGFQLRGGGWYAEARIQHLGDYKTWPGCTAFWSMDSDHLDHSIGRNFLEPDFWENISGSEVTALHNWQDMAGHKKVSNQYVRGMSFDPKQWFTVGAMVEGDLSAYRWHRNGKVTGSATPSWLSMFRDFNGPIIIGSGPACPIRIDYIRVWEQ